MSWDVYFRHYFDPARTGVRRDALHVRAAVTVRRRERSLGELGRAVEFERKALIVHGVKMENVQLGTARGEYGY